MAEATAFEGNFATSAAYLTVLKFGKRVILAEMTNINVEGSK